MAMKFKHLWIYLEALQVSLIYTKNWKPAV